MDFVNYFKNSRQFQFLRSWIQNVCFSNSLLTFIWSKVAVFQTEKKNWFRSFHSRKITSIKETNLKPQFWNSINIVCYWPWHDTILLTHNPFDINITGMFSACLAIFFPFAFPFSLIFHFDNNEIETMIWSTCTQKQFPI